MVQLSGRGRVRQSCCCWACFQRCSTLAASSLLSHAHFTNDLLVTAYSMQTNQDIQAGLTNRSRPSESGETERVSSGQLAQMLEERGIPVPGQVAAVTAAAAAATAAATANQPAPSLVSSGSTNPFTSSELRARMGTKAPAPAHDESEEVPQDLPQDPPPEDAPRSLHPSTRVIIEYSDKMSIDVVPAGNTDSDAEAASRRPYIELNAAQSSPNTFRSWL